MTNFIDPAALGAIMQTGELRDRNEEITRLVEDERLRQQRPGPEGRNAGGMYIAANPMEHLAELLRKRQAQQSEERLRADLETNRGAMTGAREQYIAELLRQMGNVNAGPVQSTP